MVDPWPVSDPSVVAPPDGHDDLRDVIRRMLTKHAPHDAIREASDSDLGYAPELWSRLNTQLGIGGLAISEEQGGTGLGLAELAVVLEETGAALLPEPVLATAVLGCQALAAADDAPEHRTVLEEALKGTIVSVSLEPRHLVAEPNSDPYLWTVSGRVPYLLQAQVATHLVLSAETEEGAVVLLLVDAASVDRSPLNGIDATRRQAEVTCEVAPAQLLVSSERASGVLAFLQQLNTMALASEHTGIVGHLLYSTQHYLTQREQFGRPIASFQAIKHRLADLLVDVERARSASRYAAAVLDHGSDDAELAVAVAASICTDAAIKASNETIQLHGGIGFTWEHEAHYYLRRVLGNEALFGDSRSHRARVADLLAL